MLSELLRLMICSCLCRFFVIANAIASGYNLMVLVTRRILQRRAQSLSVHLLDMVSASCLKCRCLLVASPKC